MSQNIDSISNGDTETSTCAHTFPLKKWGKMFWRTGSQTNENNIYDNHVFSNGKNYSEGMAVFVHQVSPLAYIILQDAAYMFI